MYYHLFLKKLECARVSPLSCNLSGGFPLHFSSTPIGAEVCCITMQVRFSATSLAAPRGAQAAERYPLDLEIYFYLSSWDIFLLEILGYISAFPYFAVMSVLITCCMLLFRISNLLHIVVQMVRHN